MNVYKNVFTCKRARNRRMTFVYKNVFACTFTCMNVYKNVALPVPACGPLACSLLPACPPFSASSQKWMKRMAQEFGVYELMQLLKRFGPCA